MKTLYIYGDSNTYGYDPSDFWGGRYEEKDVWTSIVHSGLSWEWTVIADGLIIPAHSEPPVRTLRATIPENKSH